MIRWLRAYLKQHWMLHLTMFGVVLLLAANMAAIPLVTQVLAKTELDTNLANTSIENGNILLTGDVEQADVEALDAALEDIMIERMEARSLRLRALHFIFPAEAPSRELTFTDFLVDIWAFDRIDEKATLLAGNWPSTERRFNRQSGTPIVEALVGASAANDMALRLGDRVLPAVGSFEIEVVGIVSVNDLSDPIWWGDEFGRPFIAWRRQSVSPDIDEMTLGVIIPIEQMDFYVTKQSDWRYLLDAELLADADPEEIHERFVALQPTFSAGDIELQSGPIKLFSRFLEEQSAAQATLFFLLTQSLLGAIYTIGILASALVDQSQGEMGVLASRGFKSWQLTLRFALLGLLSFGVVAFPLAPFLAQAGVRIWSGESIAPTQASWQLAMIVSMAAWLTLVITVQRFSGRNILEWLQRHRQFGGTGRYRQQLVLDAMILAVGGLIYWQLQQSRSILTLPETGSENIIGQADPLLLLAPTILIVAIALVWRRLFPLILQLAAILARRANGFTLPMGMTRLARSPAAPARVIFLITITAALTAFTLIFIDSLSARQRALAHYAAGATARVALPDDADAANELEAQLRALPEAQAATRVFRANVNILDETGARLSATLLAIEPDSFTSVALFPEGISEFTIDQIVGVIQPGDGELSLVRSNAPIAHDLDRGETFTIEMGRQRMPGQIVGIIAEFPTVDALYIVTHLSELEGNIDLSDFSILNSQFELWMDGSDALVTQLQSLEEVVLLDDTVTLENDYASTLITQQTITGLRINRNLLLILSSVGFLIVQLFATRRRLGELGIMNALGVSLPQLQRLLLGESLLMLLFGLLMGSGSGYFLARMMRPLLNETLAPALRSRGLGALTIDNVNLIATILLLGVVYGLTLFLLHRITRRLNVASSLLIGDE